MTTRKKILSVLFTVGGAMVTVATLFVFTTSSLVAVTEAQEVDTRTNQDLRYRLGTYDSGWFPVSNQRRIISLRHHLGDLPANVVVYQCGSLSSFDFGTDNPFDPNFFEPFDPRFDDIFDPRYGDRHIDFPGTRSFEECDSPAVVSLDGYKDGSAFINPIQTLATDDHIMLTMNPAWWAWGIWSPTQGWQCPQDDDRNCNTAYYRVIASR